MDEKAFCYWLKGYFELSDSTTLTPNQVLMIKEHLKLVFTKVTPNIDLTLTQRKPLEWLQNPIPDRVEITCSADESHSTAFSTYLRSQPARLC